MPFYLSLATFLMSLSFFAFGMLKSDPFIFVSASLTIYSTLQPMRFPFDRYPHNHFIEVEQHYEIYERKYCCTFEIASIDLAGHKVKHYSIAF